MSKDGIENGGKIVITPKTEVIERKPCPPQINRQLLPVKLLFFFFFGAQSCMMTFSILHMRVIGFTMEGLTFVLTVLPLISFAGAPIAGAIVDKYGYLKLVMILCLFLNAGLHNLLLAIPTYSNTVHPASLNTSSDSTGITVIQWDGCSTHSCNEPALSALQRTHNFTCSSSCNSSITDKSNASSEILSLLLDSSRSPFVLDSNGSWESINNKTKCLHTQQSNDLFNESLHFIESFNVSDCEIRCDSLMPEKCVVEEGDYRVTFWLYLVIRGVAILFMAGAFGLGEAITIQTARRLNVDYGKQRLLGLIGMVIFSPVSGLLVDYVSKIKGYPDYSSAFYMYDLMCFLAICCVLAFPSTDKPPPSNLIREASILLRQPHMVGFFFSIIIMGTIFGFIRMFSPILVKVELNGPNALVGMMLSSSALSSFVPLYYSGPITRKLGCLGVMLISFSVYFVRAIVYSYLRNPWYSLLLEAMEAITMHLNWVAMVTYAAKEAPKTMQATAQGLVFAFHYNVGIGLGCLIGGNMVSTYGIRPAFRMMAGISIGGGFVLALLCLYVQWLGTKNHEKQKSGEEGEQMKEVAKDDEDTKREEDGDENKEVQEKLLNAPDEDDRRFVDISYPSTPRQEDI